jgi:hypothetical protein
MKQVKHGMKLTNELLVNKAEDLDLRESIRAQLSHSDGIRGFMVSYLTADQSPADDPQVPSALLQALQELAKTEKIEDLIPLTCKFVL